MIRLSLRAQLGNQMFQYAAVRTFAEQHNQAFVWGPPAESLPDRIRIALGRKPRLPIRLAQYFELGSDTPAKRFLLGLKWATLNKHNITLVKPEHEETPEGVFREKWVDLDQYRDTNHLEVMGWLQSEKYFAENRPAILNWFALKPKHLQQWQTAERSLDVPADSRCCLHVRRGDYLTSDMGMANGDDGWALPVSYYRNAWEQVPQGIIPVIISDAPDYVEEMFDWLPEAHVLRGNPAVVDMWVMKNSRYRIIANSSFSWWGAWLAEIEGQTYLPEYFLGWTRKAWVPVGILPAGWEPVTVNH